MSSAPANKPEPPPAVAEPAAGIAELLGEAQPSPWRRLTRPVLIALALALALAAGLLVWGRLSAPAAVGYVTEPLRRGDLVVEVSATGDLQPVNTVSVGSERSGTVVEVLVDDNDHVRRGQVLARLDTAVLDDQIAVNTAALASAEANARQAEATLREADLAHGRNLQLAARTDGEYPARSAIDASKASLDRAQAALAAARSAVLVAQANLRTSRTNLEKAVIRSPIDGVVLSRSVEPGQTVAASLQAPVLFILAEDLTRMELQVNIDEADVGQVRPGQAASFTVDAFPARTYAATLTRVGLGSKTTDGVVTYTGLLSVDNADQSLRPGMTATAQIVANRRSSVLIAPASALRFQPAAAQPAAGQQGLVASLTPRMPGANRRARNNGNGEQQLWILRDGQPVAMPVTVGATDGQSTEVSGPGLSAGMAVITSQTGTP
jgi:HlyD family secretion protein